MSWPKLIIVGIVDDDAIARPEQEPQRQIERLRRRIGKHDAVGVDRRAALGEPRRDEPAQRLETERQIIAQPRALTAARQRPDRLLEARGGQPALRKPARGGLQHIRPVFQRAPHQGQQVDRGVEPRRLGEHQRPRRLSDEKPGAAPRLDQPERGEAVVALDHRRAGNSSSSASFRTDGSRAPLPSARKSMRERSVSTTRPTRVATFKGAFTTKLSDNCIRTVLSHNEKLCLSQSPASRHPLSRKDDQMKILIRPSLPVLAGTRRPFRVAKPVAIPYLGHRFTRRTIK